MLVQNTTRPLVFACRRSLFARRLCDVDSQRCARGYLPSLWNWLATDGVGAQLIVIDNSPPDTVSEHVVVHYTRNAMIPPYGLITDAVD